MELEQKAKGLVALVSRLSGEEQQRAAGTCRKCGFGALNTESCIPPPHPPIAVVFCPSWAHPECPCMCSAGHLTFQCRNFIHAMVHEQPADKEEEVSSTSSESTDDEDDLSSLAPSESDVRDRRGTVIPGRTATKRLTIRFLYSVLF